MANAKLLCSSIFSSTKLASVPLLKNNFDFFLTRSNIAFLKGNLRLSHSSIVNVLERSTVPVEKEDSAGSGKMIIEGTVILIEKTVLGFNDFHASFLDRVYYMVGRKVSFQLVSAAKGDPGNDMKGRRSRPAYLGDCISAFHGIQPGESAFKVTFEWDEDFGLPGAVIVRNEHHSEFYLKSVVLDGNLDHDKVHFVCNSWVYPAKRCRNEHRIFFCNKMYLPDKTPASLRSYRAEELETLRGNGEGKLEEWDRVYDYAYYNDLGDPDKGAKYARPVLGGSKDYPYPRRGRTGRSPTITDQNSESRLPYAMSLDIYIPRDERFGHLKLADYLSHTLKAVTHAVQAELKAVFDKSPMEFDCLEDTLKLYREGVKLHDAPSLTEKTTLNLLKDLLHINKVPHLKFPLPHIIKDDKSAWTSDEEFAREMLAGVNPVVISRLEVFPPVSKLDPKKYGDHRSSIRENHIESNLDGLTVDEAMKNKKIFILDHHDTLMRYLRHINTTDTKTYATRTLLFLKDDGTLKPLAIELSLPHPNGDGFGVISNVFTPAARGVEGAIWQLAKVYVSVNDSGYHQLISHWLNTHAAMEPFVIATNRQLSVLHPIHKLLRPHFRDTMNINALARQILIGAGGVLEQTVFPGKYAMEMSSALYKNWVFTDQALPKDLMKRGMAEKDPNSPQGYRLLIEDYPYAVDGLQIWSAIEEWVREYCSFYYENDDMVVNDTELQSWWREVREEGHGDLKDEIWWPKMRTVEDLIESCSIIIWVASALHAALNFGQYPYAGYLPNRPTTSRRFMPEPNTPEYEELKTNPEGVLLKTITSQLKTLLGVALIQVLSTHTSDEVYLGQRDVHDAVPMEAFEKFTRRLQEIEGEIEERNKSRNLRNRAGRVNMPYTLLIPTSDAGVTGRGIPNSISI